MTSPHSAPKSNSFPDTHKHCRKSQGKKCKSSRVNEKKIHFPTEDYFGTRERDQHNKNCISLWISLFLFSGEEQCSPLPRKACHFYPTATLCSVFSSSLGMVSGLFCISSLCTLKLPFNTGPLQPLELLNTYL